MIVEVEVSDGVGTITLNRPEARNALSGEVTELLDEAIVRLDADEHVGAMILTGADPAFCAGFDLRALSTELRSVQQQRQKSPLRHLGLMPEHQTPIIGAINGATVTGGLELAMSCDFLIASDRARFADTHARVGAMPGGGMTIRLPELIGIDRARRMTFTGDFIDAQTAYEWGLVVEVVPHEGLMDRARAIASTIASIPRENIREVRRMYEDIGAMVGKDAWIAESRASRDWMAQRFDQSRLAKERDAIIARGRDQSSGASGTPT
jgi:enoyl-CoA hydratase